MKSYVTMEQHACPICCDVFDTNNLLLDKSLNDRFEMHTVTGYEMCAPCQKFYDDGYIALVEIDEGKSSARTLEGAYRTGNLARVLFTAWEKVFNTAPPLREDGESYEFVFVGKGMIETLQGKITEQKP